MAGVVEQPGMSAILVSMEMRSDAADDSPIVLSPAAAMGFIEPCVDWSIPWGVGVLPVIMGWVA